MEYILTKRLTEFLAPAVSWGEHTIHLEDIEKGIKEGLESIAEPFAHANGFVEDFKTKEWHIGRILYFIRNPHKIDPIWLDNECMNGYILPIPAMVDGCHRYLASLFLKSPKIAVEYGGRMDLLDYLKGTTNELPIH